ncbi:hypothetical protein O181_006358 [Austropuccinia psidii MF-1]|uniref:Uncharacterized protein n=1 Tax=Austropuccinia psidii MF-1 TaxID=1389203 RepID=A0A9Q3GGI4_9BASI|nr:hypothetical protein [Austropuccinia psidii MF-1]
MGITKRWNPNRKFKILEEREAKIGENQATIKPMEEKWSQKDNTFIPSGSKEMESQPNYSVDSYHTEYGKSGSKSHDSSQFLVVSRRRKGSKGKNRNSFS